MNEKQIQQALQEIAEQSIPNSIDLWPQITAKTKHTSRSFVWQWGGRLAGTAVASFALFLFALWILSLPQFTEITIDTPLNQTIEPSMSVTVDPELIYPDAPASLPLYQVEMEPPPQTTKAILEWAQEFGLPDPKLFLDPHSSETILAVGSDDSRLVFPAPGKNWGGIGYIREDWLDIIPQGEPVSFTDGKIIAQAFLAKHQQLPIDYQMVDTAFPFFSNDVRMIQVTLGLNGYPVLQSATNGIGSTLQIDTTGVVVSAGFAEGTFIEVDTVLVRPAEEVIAEFVDGNLIPLAQEYTPAYYGWGDITQYTAPLQQHTIGERVTILETDDTHFLIAEDGSEIRAVLATSVGNKYDLITSDLAQISERIGYDQLRVMGTIESQLSSDKWRLLVDTWEILPQQDISSGCAIGPVTIDASGAWIVAEDALGAVVVNGRYQLENLPSAIQNGDRIEACGEPIPDVGGTLPWINIYALPRDRSHFDQPINGDQFVIESVQLLYLYDMDDTTFPLPLATPVWMVSGYTPDRTAHHRAYLDAAR